VVLPFYDLESQSESAYLTEGFANEVIIALSRFRSLRVVVNSVSRRFVPTVGCWPSLGVHTDFAVETTMTRIGEQIRFQFQMVDVRFGLTRWAEAITVHQDELVGLERDIAGKIAAALDRAASDALLNGKRRLRGGAFETFDCWLRGQHRLYHGDWTREGEQEAIDWFHKALLVDPTFARAHSSLALTLNVQPLVRPGLAFGSEREKALDHARKALAYDESDARSHLAMAWVSMVGQDRSRAERHFTLAANLNPNAADVLINCALGEAELGQREKAAQLAERAIALNPTYPEIYDFFLAQIRLHAGDYAGALEIGTSISTMTPAFPAWLAAAAALAGNRSLADAFAEQFLTVTRSRWEGPEPFSRPRAVDWLLSVSAPPSNPYRAELKKGLLIAGLEPSESGS